MAKPGSGEGSSVRSASTAAVAVATNLSATTSTPVAVLVIAVGDAWYSTVRACWPTTSGAATDSSGSMTSTRARPASRAFTASDSPARVPPTTIRS